MKSTEQFTPEAVDITRHQKTITGRCKLCGFLLTAPVDDFDRQAAIHFAAEHQS